MTVIAQPITPPSHGSGERASLYSHLKQKYSKYHEQKIYHRFVMSPVYIAAIGGSILLSVWIILKLFGQITFESYKVKNLGDGMNLNLAVMAANAILVVISTSMAYFYKDSFIPFDKSDEIHLRIKNVLLKKHGKADEVYIIDFDEKNKEDLNFLRAVTHMIRSFSKRAHFLSLVLIFITTGWAIVDIPFSLFYSDSCKGIMNIFVVSLEFLTFILLSHYGVQYFRIAIRVKNDVTDCINSDHFDKAYRQFKMANEDFKTTILIEDIGDMFNP